VLASLTISQLAFFAQITAEPYITNAYALYYTGVNKTSYYLAFAIFILGTVPSCLLIDRKASRWSLMIALMVGLVGSAIRLLAN